jgi:hypothetical protein
MKNHYSEGFCGENPCDVEKNNLCKFLSAFLFMLCHGYILAEIKHLPAFITLLYSLFY